jgi:hypothetical protein
VYVTTGSNQTFSANVRGSSGYDRSVTWSVIGGSTGTAISDAGELTVAAGESAATLTVRATSTVNSAETGTAEVRIGTDNRATLAAGTAVTVAADDITATVRFTGATGLTLATGDFAVTNGGNISAVSVASDTATVSIGFAANTFTRAAKTYTVSIAATGTTINGSTTVVITQRAAFLTIGTLAERLAWIASHAVDNGDYTIEIRADEAIAPTWLSYDNKTVHITLKGDGTERTVSLASLGALFTMRSGVTLTLDNNVKLQGRSDNTTSLVKVAGGSLEMNGNSKVTGNTAYGGGGVDNDSGTFTMNGGEISGNTALAGEDASQHTDRGGGVLNFFNGIFTMNGGKIFGNTAGEGGGVLNYATFTLNGGEISDNTATNSGGGLGNFGAFTMSGGQISGNTAAINGGGGVYDFQADGSTFTKTGGTIYGDTDTTHTPGSTENTAIDGRGHAVHSYNGNHQLRDDTAGTDVNLNNATDTNWVTD